MEKSKINLSKYENRLGRKHQFIRLVWSVVWPLCTWFLPRSVGNGWKSFLLRLFGAKIDSTAAVYSSARIYYPANLVMGRYACISGNVVCYNVAPVILGEQVTISQEAYICTASHDITDPLHHLAL